MTDKWVIVGAGLSGATLAERIASQRGEPVTVIEQRSHIAGNTYDETNEHGILEHKYGPHIFHTNSDDVWRYLSTFTEWRHYEHEVQASVEGKLVPLPFNLNSIDLLFDAEKAKRLTDKLLLTYQEGAKVPVLTMRESDDSELKALADYVYQHVFEQYTIKQWALRPEQLARSVTARVPILVGRDNRYFHDTHQGLPKDGYTKMVERMLEHPNITVQLNTSWESVRDQFAGSRVIYTGQIDQYFDYQFGELPYRSLRFDSQTVNQQKFQPVGTVNYPNDHAYTRITEQKHLTGQVSEQTTLVYEYPMAHERDQTLPFYPIPTDDNRALYARYREEAKQHKVLFVGRLANYIYYNMDQAVAAALKTYRDISD